MGNLVACVVVFGLFLLVFLLGYWLRAIHAAMIRKDAMQQSQLYKDLQMLIQDVPVQPLRSHMEKTLNDIIAAYHDDVTVDTVYGRLWALRYRVLGYVEKPIYDPGDPYTSAGNAAATTTWEEMRKVLENNATDIPLCTYPLYMLSARDIEEFEKMRAKYVAYTEPAVSVYFFDDTGCELGYASVFGLPAHYKTHGRKWDRSLLESYTIGRLK